MPPKAVHARALALYIVDTDVSVREGLVRLAESAGFEPRPCVNAQAFVRLLPDGTPACAVVDLSDAGLRDPAIRARLAVVASRVPMIALSAHDDEQTQRTAREVGARAFFRKPVDAAALLDSIDWVMRAG